MSEQLMVLFIFSASFSCRSGLLSSFSRYCWKQKLHFHAGFGR